MNYRKRQRPKPSQTSLRKIVRIISKNQKVETMNSHSYVSGTRYRAVYIVETDNLELFDTPYELESHPGTTLQHYSVTPVDSVFSLEDFLISDRQPKLIGLLGIVLLVGQMFMNSLF
ncbi:MAG: hypothetical protein AAGG53_03985 [Cyanobacteria bacterium P01_H01_bin.152]